MGVYHAELCQQLASSREDWKVDGRMCRRLRLEVGREAVADGGGGCVPEREPDVCALVRARRRCPPSFLSLSRSPTFPSRFGSRFRIPLSRSTRSSSYTIPSSLHCIARDGDPSIPSPALFPISRSALNTARQTYLAQRAMLPTPRPSSLYLECLRRTRSPSPSAFACRVLLQSSGLGT